MLCFVKKDDILTRSYFLLENRNILNIMTDEVKPEATVPAEAPAPTSTPEVKPEPAAETKTA